MGLTWAYTMSEVVTVSIAVQQLCQANPATPPETQLLLRLQSPCAMSALWRCGHTFCEAPVSLLHP